MSLKWDYGFDFVGYWLGSESVKTCSMGARGLWTGLFSIMSSHDGILPDYLFTLDDGCIRLTKACLSLLHYEGDLADLWMKEIQDAEVVLVSGGRVVCVEIVKAVDLSRKRSAAGRMGADVKYASGDGVEGVSDLFGGGAKLSVECPQEEIIGLYHEILPMMSSILVSRWKGSRTSAFLNTRWAEGLSSKDKEFSYKTQAEGLEWWRNLFVRVSKSNWLTGRDPNAGGWKANLQWIVRPENFTKILMGSFDQSAPVNGGKHRIHQPPTDITKPGVFEEHDEFIAEIKRKFDKEGRRVA